MTFFNMLETQVLGNNIGQWLLALLILLLLTGVLTLIRNFVARWISRIETEKRGQITTLLSDIIARTKPVVLLLIALYAASLFLVLPATVTGIIYGIAFVAAFVQIGIWGNYFIVNSLKRYMGLKMAEPATSSGIVVMSLIGKMILWSVVLLIILDNLGVNITTLIAGLGIGGIAIGLATQNILGDLFASLSILLDRPFEAGHFIIVGDHLGTVERIGLKTTRIRSLSGEQLIFGNNDLLQSRIRNFTHFQERRVVFTFGVLYDTPAEKLKKIPGMVREIIESIENTRFDRAHFKEFGDFSLNFEVVYYVLSPDYIVYMDIQEKINLGIFEALETEEIGFAFPTRTIHIASQPGENISSEPAGT